MQNIPTRPSAVQSPEPISDDINFPDKSEQTNLAKRSTAQSDVEPRTPRCVHRFCGRLSVLIIAVALAAPNHFPNPAMEEAASLFGPADSASDLFESIVTNAGDDLAWSSTSPPNDVPRSETREGDVGSNWFDDASSSYQADASLHSEYVWQSSNDAGHYNFQPQYEGSTPGNFADKQPHSTHVGDGLQHTASRDGECLHLRQVLVSPRV